MSEPIPVAGRVVPHDLDAEAAVLAAVLLERDALDRVLELLKPEHFYSDANRRIFEGAVDLATEGTPVDIQTIASWLRSRELINQIGGPSYLVQLVDATPSVANVGAYAKVVHEKWRVRQLIGTCQRIAAEGYGDVGEVQEFLNGASASIQAVCATGSDDPGSDIDVIMKEVFNDLTIDEPDDTEGIYTGIWPLDHVNGPLRPGSVTTVLAYSSHGKSAFCAGVVNFASHLGAGRAECSGCGDRPPCPWRAAYIKSTPQPNDPRCQVCGEALLGRMAGVLVFSGEMRKKDYGKRMVQIRSRINLRDFKQGNCTDEERAKVITAIAQLADQKSALRIDDKTVDVIKIRPIIARKKIEMAKLGIDLVAVIFDYAQRAKFGNGSQFRGNRQQELGEIGRHLKETAVQESVAIILPAQLNEEARRKGLKPNAENVREAQDLVNDSDNTIVIYAPHRDSSVDKDLSKARVRMPEPVQFRVGKGRDGERGFVPGAFLPWVTAFDIWRTSYGEYVLPEEKKEEREYRGRRQ